MHSAATRETPVRSRPGALANANATPSHLVNRFQGVEQKSDFGSYVLLRFEDAAISNLRNCVSREFVCDVLAVGIDYSCHLVTLPVR